MVKKCLVTGLISVSIFISSQAYSFPYKGLDIKVEGGINEMYDDNITITSDAEKQKEDYITNLSLELGVKHEGRTRNIVFSGRTNQQFYADNNNLDRNSQNFSLNFTNEISDNQRISIEDVYTHLYEPSGFEDSFGRPEGRYSTYKNRLNLRYEIDVADGVSVSTSYANEKTDVSRDDMQDSSLDRYGVEAKYFPGLATAFTCSYGFVSNKLDDGAKAATQSVALGLRQNITKNFYFNLSAGEDFIETFDGNEDTAENYQGSLTNEISENTLATLSFSKKKQSISNREDMFDSWQASGGLTKTISEKVKSSFSGFYGEGEYSVSGLAEKLRGVQLGFDYEFREDVRWDLSYAYSAVDYTALTSSSGYTRNTISLGLKMGF